MTLLRLDNGEKRLYRGRLMYTHYKKKVQAGGNLGTLKAHCKFDSIYDGVIALCKHH